MTAKTNINEPVFDLNDDKNVKGSIKTINPPKICKKELSVSIAKMMMPAVIIATILPIIIFLIFEFILNHTHKFIFFQAVFFWR